MSEERPTAATGESNSSRGVSGDEPPDARLPHSWIGIGIGFGVLICAVGVSAVLVVQFLASRPVNLLGVTEALSEELQADLERGDIPKQSIRISQSEERRDAKARWNYYVVDCDVPSTISLEGVEQLIRGAMSERNVAVSGSLTDRKAGGLSLRLAGHDFALVRATQVAVAAAQQTYAPAATVAATSGLEMTPEELPLDSTGLSESEVTEPHVPPGAAPGGVAQPRLAIIVDDGGYGGPTTNAILALDPALTLAILPNTPHGTETAKRAEELGFEVMLHMPMAAVRAKDDFPGYLAVTMSAAQMRTLTDAALQQVPGAVGINNHTGSEFTANRRAMKEFLEGLSGRSLYFVDSHTSADSVAYSEAQALGIKSTVNNLFLDNNADPAAIRAQVEKLALLCKTRGQAVGIGHFRSHTAAALAEEIPKLKAEGITLVHVSELVK